MFLMRATTRIKIDGDWSPQEMADFLTTWDGLYHLNLLLEHAKPEKLKNSSGLESEVVKWTFPATATVEERTVAIVVPMDTPRWANADLVRSITSLFPSDCQAKIRRVVFASPGFFDIAGLGEVVKQLKELIQFAVTHFSNRQSRSIEIAIQGERHRELQLHNTRELLQIARDFQIGEWDVNQLASRLRKHEDLIFALVSEGKITGAEDAPDADDPNVTVDH